MLRLGHGTHLRVLGPWVWDVLLIIGPANGIGVRPESFPMFDRIYSISSKCTSPLEAKKFGKFSPPEESHGLSVDRISNLTEGSQTP